MLSSNQQKVNMYTFEYSDLMFYTSCYKYTLSKIEKNFTLYINVHVHKCTCTHACTNYGIGVPLTLLPHTNNSTSSAVNMSARYLSFMTRSNPLLNASNCFEIDLLSNQSVWRSTYSCYKRENMLTHKILIKYTVNVCINENYM